MQLHLRKCSPEDLNLLISISKKTFVDAFEKDNDPDDFKTYVDFAFEGDKLLSELKNPNIYFFFVFKDADLAGYLKLNENDAQTDIKTDTAIELERIYVLQHFQGQQVGRWMLDEVKKIAFDKQKEFLWLGVWEKNPKAITFYEKHGFSKFGIHPYYVGNDKQTDWLMRFDLINFRAS